MEEEWAGSEEIMEDGAGALPEAFMENLNIQPPGDEIQLHDVVYEDELEDDDSDLFDLF